VNNRGCCNVCAKRCHKGHDVVYGKNTKCYCDCGDGSAPNPCKCLNKDGKFYRKNKEKERKYADLNLKSKHPFNSNTFFSTFAGNVGQLEEFLK